MVRSRVGRVAGALALLAVTWFFGGVPGAVVGVVLGAALLRGATPSFFWGVGAVAVPVAAFAVLFQGLAPVAGPAFGEHHWVAHLAAGVGLASLTVAAAFDVAAVRRGPDGWTVAGEPPVASEPPGAGKPGPEPGEPPPASGEPGRASAGPPADGEDPASSPS